MQTARKFGLVIHGGAGSLPFKLPLWYEKEEKAALIAAVELGYTKLSEDSTAIEAVEAAIKILEDSPYFNAGKGAAKGENGFFEMDAGIMNGSNLKSGAVGAMKGIKNPICAARKVMENCKHNLLVGEGAQQFAQEQGCEQVEQSYYNTDDLRQKLRESINQTKEKQNEEQKYGTVGAVALDKFGNLAAGTSTGGITSKKQGRIGDSPIIGHGNYANNLCAISATGAGERIMTAVMAFDIAAYMEYKQATLEQSCNYILFEKYKKLFQEKAKAGIIAIDKEGNFCFPFSTQVIDRAVKLSDGTFYANLY